VGKISGFNIWSAAMGLSEIAQRAVGCGIEAGDILDWSRFSFISRITNVLIYPPSCLDVGGNFYELCIMHPIYLFL
jgi:hypothetical protein